MVIETWGQCCFVVLFWLNISVCLSTNFHTLQIIALLPSTILNILQHKFKSTCRLKTFCTQDTGEDEDEQKKIKEKEHTT